MMEKKINSITKCINKVFVLLVIIQIACTLFCSFANVNVINYSKVYANEPDKIGNGFNTGFIQNEELDKQNSLGVYNTLSRITGVIIVCLQVASIAGIIFVGIRYMFAGADAKADMKGGLINLVIGMIIIFGASTVIGFVTGTFSSITKPLQ